MTTAELFRQAMLKKATQEQVNELKIRLKRTLNYWYEVVPTAKPGSLFHRSALKFVDETKRRLSLVEQLPC
ncbi:hypothetical protein K0504_18105 [Neiella marina]|uniref:Uncharacterized protein n=1 Tax=Neiella holothuriorum TaxID=2870530 RepID=A0ABS7EKS9_9GAMM|nr:hypothetical protein [Neiella holothuriorum]MBW8192949.1 hypothetical protein [Neiella holothuriorum]